MLQWGRTFSSAENPKGLHLMPPLLRRFNGAALFQVRKKSKQALVQSAKQGFNGAALFQVRKRNR